MSGILKVDYKEVLDEDIYSLLEPYIKEKGENLYITAENFAIDLYKVANILGLTLSPKYLADDISGYLENDIIYFNKNHSENRQRFTIAHEIGHFLFKHQDKVKFRKAKSTYTKDELYEEKLANNFSANLIMPQKQMKALVVKFYNNNEISLSSGLSYSEKEELIEFISRTVHVSKIATSYRLFNLGLIKL
ncbi:TPA: ImmA/IrrE family metallo-endopeptidase [Staphylococcus aureus]|uniref:ImmA/IrrE family metallo-endopeptidase n=1 Tax=Staphylococcus aureus TaxID=1280 RepID=UPI00091D7489|nr:ImmA/IrrE family metallo-endopeptidase [Staphylococcus aureus]QPV65662.1 ImmA/IrrE family metallo-endopeptidase [Staphylococcus aureus]SGR31722.1 Domain of uncharacterised function (DUF955) [Staphylococcus aureus]SGT77749.1 Domain of uncharacterised function (DUF955) [Staphylococcus aureus]SGU09788.1 Domain of uncharacterised function (DUF955) [Staphylococcus aureus]HBC8029313.1 ImmA/IrrE family metallo-endopeptidase [Staphylococcus aureus]